MFIPGCRFDSQVIVEEKKVTSLKKTNVLKKAIVSIFLPLGFVLATVFSRWPFSFILTLPIRLFKLIDFIFLVYPGKTKDIVKYCPLWLARTPIFRGKPTFAGLITKGSSGQRGLYLVVPELISEILSDKKIMERIMKALSKFSRSLGGKKIIPIAMAGRLPSAAKKHGLSVGFPFVSGVRGTVFSVLATFNKAIEQYKFGLNAKIVLIGVGHVGEPLMDTLKSLGYEVVGIDKKPSDREDVYSPEAGSFFVSNADVIIILTAEGEDFQEYSPYVKWGTVILDDTHPRLPEEKVPIGAFLHKVIVYQDNFRFLPALSGFRGNEVVGCCVEAATMSYALDQGVTNPEELSQLEFNKIAERAGFYASL